MRKTIPKRLVQTNQSFLILTVILAIVFQQPALILIAFLLLATAFITKNRINLIFWLGKTLFAKQLHRGEPEDAEVQRFNSLLANIFLGFSSLSFYVFDLPVLGWSLAVMLGVVCSIALSGFCIGCVLYFQFKQMRLRYRMGK